MVAKIEADGPLPDPVAGGHDDGQVRWCWRRGSPDDDGDAAASVAVGGEDRGRGGQAVLGSGEVVLGTDPVAEVAAAT